MLLGILLAIGFSMSSTFREGPVLEETLKGATFVGMAAAAQFFVVVGGGIDLSVGAVAALAAMVGAVVMDGKDGNIPLAIAAALGVGVGVGLVNGLLVTLLADRAVHRHLRHVLHPHRRRLHLERAARSASRLRRSTTCTSTSGSGIPALLVIMGVFWAICWYVARQTAFGKHLYALGGDREAARLAGVRTTRISIGSYVLCSTIAAAAGLLQLTQTSVGAPDLGGTLLLATVTAVVTFCARVSSTVWNSGLSFALLNAK